MQEKNESNREDTIKGCRHEAESVVPEQDFDELVMDIKNDFDVDSDIDDCDAIRTIDLE